jgi:integral membrane protein
LLKTPIGRLRVIAFIEGISYLVLLCVAMPLKYFAGLPLPVKIAGWIHGLLFVLYLMSVAEVTVKRRWSVGKIFVALVASLIPFGTFALDARLRREQESETSEAERDVHGAGVRPSKAINRSG